jgi:RNA polymerase sigma-70 factor (ECF subfamily)
MSEIARFSAVEPEADVAISPTV